MANYSISNFIRPVTTTDTVVQIKDISGSIKYTIVPCNVETTEVKGRYLKVNFLGKTNVILDFSDELESSTAISLLQVAITDIKQRFPCDGPVATSGTSGTSGTSTNSSSDGYLGIWRYNSNLIDTDIDPGNSYFAMNIVDWQLPATNFSINDNCFSPIVDLGFGLYLDAMSVGSLIRVVKFNDENVYKYFRIIGVIPPENGFEKYRVQQIGSSGTIAQNDDEFAITFFPQMSSFEQFFEIPSDEWIVIHNLNKKPEVIIYQSMSDNTFQQIIGLIEYVTPNRLIVRFNQQITGYVRCT
jgi:hypothetical protein